MERIVRNPHHKSINGHIDTLKFNLNAVNAVPAQIFKKVETVYTEAEKLAEDSREYIGICGCLSVIVVKSKKLANQPRKLAEIATNTQASLQEMRLWLSLP
eukprot:5019590-Alexandrium_andersonii.AAC.1